MFSEVATAVCLIHRLSVKLRQIEFGFGYFTICHGTNIIPMDWLYPRQVDFTICRGTNIIPPDWLYPRQVDFTICRSTNIIPMDWLYPRQVDFTICRGTNIIPYRIGYIHGKLILQSAVALTSSIIEITVQKMALAVLLFLHIKFK